MNFYEMTLRAAENGGAGEVAPAAPAPVVEAAPAAPAPVEAPAPAAVEAPAPAPANEFAPSLLEAGVKPATESPAEPTADAPKEPVAEAKPADSATPESKEAPAETPAPVSYEFTYPEGVKPEDFDSERMKAFTEILAEKSLPVDVGQKLIDMHVSELQQATQRLRQNQWDVFNRMQDAWRNEVKADPEIGGSRLDTAMKTCASVIEQFGGTTEQQKAIWDVMRATGAGNNVNIVKLFHRIGESLSREGTPIVAPPPRAPAMTREQRGMARYKGAN